MTCLSELQVWILGAVLALNHGLSWYLLGMHLSYRERMTARAARVRAEHRADLEAADKAHAEEVVRLRLFIFRVTGVEHDGRH